MHVELKCIAYNKYLYVLTSQLSYTFDFAFKFNRLFIEFSHLLFYTKIIYFNNNTLYISASKYDNINLFPFKNLLFW